MAISKKTVSNNKPEALYEIPHPAPPHPEPQPELLLWDSFDKAVRAVNWVHLMPGETHTEFYKDNNGDIHCVVGVGNIDKGGYPLIITDTGSDKSLSDQFNDVIKLIDKANHEISVVDCKYKNLIEAINATLAELAKNIKSLSGALTSYLNSTNKNFADVANQLATLANKVNSQSTTINETKAATDKNTSAVNTLNTNVKNIQSSVSALKTQVEKIGSTSSSDHKEISSIEAQLATLVEKLDAMQKDLDEEIDNVAELEKSLNIQNSSINVNTTNISHFTEDLKEVLKQIHHLFHEVSALKHDLNEEGGAIDRIGDLEAVVADTIKDVSRNADSITNIAEAIEVISKELDELNDKIEEALTGLDDLSHNVTSDFEAVNKAIDDLNTDMVDASAAIAKNAKDIAELLKIAGKAEIDELKDAIADVSAKAAENELALEYHIEEANIKFEEVEVKIADLSTNVDALAEELTESIEKVESDLRQYIDEVKELLSADIADVSSVLNERVDLLDASIADRFDVVDSSIVKIFEELELQAIELGYIRTDLADVSALAIDNAEKIAEVSTRLAEHAEEAAAKFVEVDSSIELLKDTDVILADSIIEVSTKLDEHITEDDERHLIVIEKLNEVDASIDNLQAADEALEDLIDSAEEKIAEVSTRLAEHIEESVAKFAEVDSSIEELREKDEQLDSSLANAWVEIESLKDAIEVIDSSIEDMQVAIEANAESIFENAENIADLSIRLEEHILDASIKFEEVDASLIELQERAEIVDSSIETLTVDLAEVSTRLEEHILDASIKFEQVDSSLEELIEQVNDLDVSLITDPSINKMFSEDIFTVNLCCYTAGGHVEVFDNYNVDTDPYYRANDYKTYVQGDDISLMAVANKGYRFNGWLKDAKDYRDSSIIDLVFDDAENGWNRMGWCGNTDINVIGTLNSGKEGADTYGERPPLTDGYTALFAKLCKIGYTINVINSDMADYKAGVDNAHVTTNGEYIESYDGYAYVDLGTNDIVWPDPCINVHHRFKYFSYIDGGTDVSITNSYEFENVLKDHTILLNFEEERYTVYAECNDQHEGDIQYSWFDGTNPSKGYAVKKNSAIAGTIIELTAVSQKTDTSGNLLDFVCWLFGDGEAGRKGMHVTKDYGIDVSAYSKTIRFTMDASTVTYLGKNEEDLTTLHLVANYAKHKH